MKMGTKSILFGAHAFWLHPWFVAWAWWKLYGFKTVRYESTTAAMYTSILDLRLWMAFFIHDFGYWDLPNMDGKEGERHPIYGAEFMYNITNDHHGWWCFMAFHSRFLAKEYGERPSPLCFADKLSLALTPWWLYLPMVRFTGEIREYQAVDKHRVDHGWTKKCVTFADDRRWLAHVRSNLKQRIANGDLSA